MTISRISRRLFSSLSLLPLVCLVSACSSSDDGASGDNTGAPVDNTPSSSGDNTSSSSSSGSGGNANANANANANGTTKTSVAGKAFFKWFDAPLTTARVDLDAGPRYALIGADGTFAFEDAPSTYDLTLTSSANGIPVIDRFVGLTAAAPRIESGVSDPSTPSTSTITGTVSGVASPIPNGQVVRIFTRNHFGGITSELRSAGQTPTFTLAPQWHGAGGASRTIKVYAIHYTPEPGGGFPKAFNGVASADVMASDGVNVTDVALPLTAPATTIVTGGFTPSSFTGNLYATLYLGDRETGVGVGFNTTGSTPFTLLLPSIPGSRIKLGYVASFPNGCIGGGETVPSPNQPIDFVLPGEPALASPIDNATFTTSMTFSWSAPPDVTGGGVYRFNLRQKGVNSGPMFFATTKELSVTLPSSFVPTKGATYVWDVYYYPGMSVDTLVSASGWSLTNRISTPTRTLSIP